MTRSILRRRGRDREPVRTLVKAKAKGRRSNNKKEEQIRREPVIELYYVISVI